MPLQDYADINISFEAETVSRVGFGAILFATEDTSEDPGTVNGPFANLDEVEEAGYGTTSAPYLFAQAAFAQGEGFSRLKIGHKDVQDTWLDALSDIRDTDSDWYALAIESRDAVDIEAVANDTEARVNLFMAVTADPDVLDGQDDSDIASVLLNQNLSRTALFFKRDGADEFPEAAWLGKVLPTDPGTENWAYRTLSGQTTDSFTSAERAALRNKRANYYESVAGNSITFGGFTSEPGIFIDVVRGLDWLQIRLQEDYIARQSAVGRIPYIGGDAVVEELIRARLDIAVDRGVIADDYDLFVPNSRDQQPSDRADRFFPGITFTATLVGAINIIQVRGTVSP